MQSNRDCDFAWTIKEGKVMSNIKASFLPNHLETHGHAVLFPVKGKVGHLRQGLQGYWPRNSIPETVIGLKSHQMQNRMLRAQDASWSLSWGLWIWGKAEGYLMQALLEEHWRTWSMTVPSSSSSPRGWAQPFKSVQAGFCCSLKSLPKVKHPP